MATEKRYRAPTVRLSTFAASSVYTPPFSFSKLLIGLAVLCDPKSSTV